MHLSINFVQQSSLLILLWIPISLVATCGGKSLKKSEDSQGEIYKHTKRI